MARACRSDSACAAAETGKPNLRRSISDISTAAPRYAPCVGFEVLASQVSAAQRVSQELGLDDSVQFLCQDALEANVSEAGLVWLNTYAWPADIKRRAVQKLLKELPESSQVV
ncbi:unnamed protein product, partial [Symbiodinium sp. KB8]